MATYVTTNPRGPVDTQHQIMIQNFIMVDNLSDIRTLLIGYQGSDRAGLPTENDLDNNNENYDCISIWNKSDRWDPEEVENIHNTQDSYQLYVNIGSLDSLESIYGDIQQPENLYKFTITGDHEGANPCKLKKIFHGLTRFRAQQLNIDHAEINLSGSQVSPVINAGDRKTLDNRIIFVRKSNIKDLFSNGTLDQAGINFDWVDSLKEFLQTRENQGIQYISNFFRGFVRIEEISETDENNIRDSLDLGDLDATVHNQNLNAFKDFINDTRELTPINTVLGTIQGILDQKTSQDGTNHSITTGFTTGNVKQHWLGNIRPRGIARVLPITRYASFRRYLREKSTTLNTRDLTNIERYIITVLALTATNGLNPTPPQQQDPAVDPCRITRVADPDNDNQR